MLRKIQDFVQMWAEEAESTVKIMRNISENSKSIVINEGVRTLERLCWHITTTNIEMSSLAGIILQTKLEDAPESTPSTIEEIIEIYEKTTKEIGEAVAAQWSDEVLTEEVPMYGEHWAKGRVLYILLGHQGHHRSQMTVIMRVLGLDVPGTWGPSREEWATMGLPAMA